MSTDEDRLGRIDLAHYQHQMFGQIDAVAVDVRAKFTESGWQPRFRNPLDQRLVTQTVFDNVSDRNDFQPMKPRELNQIVAPGHRPVFLENFAYHAGRLKPRQARQVDSTFSLAGSHQHASLTRPQWVHVS